MDKMIRVSEEVAKKLDELKHPGQSYEGVIEELIEKADNDKAPGG